MTETDQLLRRFLSVCVPMWIRELKDKPAEFLNERSQICSKHIAAHGDLILYRSKKIGDSAEAVNRLAEGIALLFLVTRNDLPEEIFGQKECPEFLKISNV